MDHSWSSFIPPSIHTEDSGDANSMHVRDRSPLSRTDLGNSTFSLSSAAEVARMQAQVNAMRAQMLAAGLEVEQVGNSDEGASRDDNRGVRIEPNDDDRKGSTFRVFMSYRPPTFEVGDDPSVCKRWILKMEQIYDTAIFTESQRVGYAILMLVGEAMDWWSVVHNELTAPVRRSLTWPQFVERVNMRFCNPGAVQRTEREFLAIQKGDMSIAEYNIAFTKKLRFAGHSCPDQKSIVARYVEGLPFEYKLAVRKQSTIDAAMGAALQVEDDLNEHFKAEKDSGKRKQEGSLGHSKSRDLGTKRVNQKRKSVFCNACNNCHIGQCGKDTMKCKRCGKMGHVFRDCKSKEPMCYNCNEMGHLSAQCPEPKKEKYDSGAKGKKKF